MKGTTITMTHTTVRLDARSKQIVAAAVGAGAGADFSGALRVLLLGAATIEPHETPNDMSNFVTRVRQMMREKKITWHEACAELGRHSAAARAARPDSPHKRKLAREAARRDRARIEPNEERNEEAGE